MVHKLKEKKIPYRLSQNGTAILVPKEQVYDIRLSLAAEGLPKGGGVGFEIFDRTNLGTTDFVQKLNYQRAMQGELSRTIKQIKEIESARVHIVTPKESIFLEEQKKPTASVFVKTRPGMSIGPSQVEGIVHLVSSAVEGLETGNITVIDTSGKILSKRNDNSLIGQLTTTQLEYQRTIEDGLKKKVQGMLEEVLGFNKAIASISTDIDFQQIDITEERYEPNTILRSEQRNTERSSSTVGGGGIETKGEKPDAKLSKPGITIEPQPKPSIPPSAPVNTSTSERQNEVRNYEISKVNKQIKSPMGSMRKISAAVVVDGLYKEGVDAKGNKERQYVSRSQDEMKNLENIVKKAIGYNEKRGDQVEVINMPFYWSNMEEETKIVKGSPWQDYLTMAYKPAISLILALLFIFYVVRPILKKSPLPRERGEALLQTMTQPMIPTETHMETKPTSSLSLKDQTAQLIQRDPSKSVGIVKTWLHEKE